MAGAYTLPPVRAGVSARLKRSSDPPTLLAGLSWSDVRSASVRLMHGDGRLRRLPTSLPPLWLARAAESLSLSAHHNPTHAPRRPPRPFHVGVYGWCGCWLAGVRTTRSLPRPHADQAGLRGV